MKLSFPQRRGAQPLHKLAALGVKGYIGEETMLSVNDKDMRPLSLKSSIPITVSKAKFSISFLYLSSVPFLCINIE